MTTTSGGDHDRLFHPGNQARAASRDRFTARSGHPPALATPYRLFRVSPTRIRARREVNEMPGRELMRPDEGQPDVLLEAGQIESGEADRGREGGPAQQMETR